MASPSHDQLAKLLQDTGDYRVLRRLKPRSIASKPIKDWRIGLIVDTETTGLDLIRDEVIELGLLAFCYADDGVIGPVIGEYEGLREPSVGISEEASTITGLTADFLEGKKLDADAVNAITERADLLIAHNAAFDRPMCERLFPVFQSKPWACSATEIPWKKHGFDGVKLSYLLTQSGFFNNGHRALDDCRSLLEVLDQRFEAGSMAFDALLQSARQPRYRVWLQAPYEARATLRQRGYRWNPGANGRPKGWWFEGDSSAVEREQIFHQEMGLSSAAASVERQTAFDRYKFSTDSLPIA